MKKLIINFIIIALSISASVLPISAIETTDHLNEVKVVQITSKNSNANAYIVDQDELIGTELEGKIVLVTTDTIYIDGVDITSSILKKIAVYIKNDLIGWLVGTTMLYVAGFNTNTLYDSALKSLIEARNTYFDMAEAYFDNYYSKLRAFRTRDGNYCVKSATGTTFNCLV